MAAKATVETQCGSEAERKEWALNASVANLPPQLTPEYTVVRVLGEGSYGKAVEVRGPIAADVGPGAAAACEPLAIKLVRVSFGSDYTGDGAETLTEIATARLLGDHPHIVPVLRVLRLRLPGRKQNSFYSGQYDYVPEDEPWIGMVMPLAAADLSAMLRRWNALDRTLRTKPRAEWTPAEVRLRELVRAARRDALSQLWCGLAAMHASGLLHLDIKPPNALLLGAPRPAPLPKAHKFDEVVDLRPLLLLEEGDGDATEAALQALVGVGAGGRWALADFGLVQRIPGAHRSRKQWAVVTDEYRDPYLEAGGAVSRDADFYAFGVMAFEVAFELAPFAGAQDAAVAREIIREVGYPRDPEAEHNEGALDDDVLAAARAVFVDRLLPAPAHYVRRLRALAERFGADDRDAAERAALTATWLERAVPGRAEGGLGAALAQPEGLDRAVARFTRWGPGTQAAWRAYWGGEFAPLARSVLALLQPDPADRSRAAADAFFFAGGGGSAAKRCAAVPPRAVRPAGKDSAFAAPRYAVFAQNTRDVADSMWRRVDRAWFPKAVWRAPGGADFVQDAVALLAAKLEQDYVYAEARQFPDTLDLGRYVEGKGGHAGQAPAADDDLRDYAIGSYGEADRHGRIRLMRGNIERTLSERGEWRPWEGVLLPVAPSEEPQRTAWGALVARRAASQGALRSGTPPLSVGTRLTSAAGAPTAAAVPGAPLSRGTTTAPQPRRRHTLSAPGSARGAAPLPRRSPRLAGQGSVR